MRTPLIDLIDQPDVLEEQMLADALIALEAIRNEIAEKGYVNTQKSQAFVSLTKLVKSQLDAKKDSAKNNPMDEMSNLVSSLPFHTEGLDEVVRASAP